MSKTLFLLVFFAVILLFACGSEQENLGQTRTENEAIAITSNTASPSTITINYYQHPPQNYERWNVWAWGIEPTFADLNAPHYFSVHESYNNWRTVTIEVPSDTTRVGFIVRLGHWEQENPQIHVELDRDSNGNPISTTIYYIHGQHHYHREKPYVGAGVQSALADWHNYIRMTMNFIPGEHGTSGSFDSSMLELRDVTYVTDFEDGMYIPILNVRRDVGRGLGGVHIPIFHVDLEEYVLQPNRHYQLRYGDNVAVTVVMRHILDQFHYTGTLGVVYTPTATTFSVWAPTAHNVRIALYNDNENKLNQTLAGLHFDSNGWIRQDFLRNPSELHPMTRNEYGVWTGIVAGDLAGQWYMFKVEQPNGNIEFAIDPYVTAVSANGQLGAIITGEQRGLPLRDENNLNRLQRGEFFESYTAPEIRRNQYGVASQVDHIIYELHIRDFSIHPSSGIPEEYRGTYMAFTISGTTVNGITGNPSTGIDHLVELGITTVHLLPIHDMQTVNELGDLSFNADGAFNWGYDPQNFNVPEGSFSTDPTIPYLRIQELKALIDSLHSRGIRVVKDVVYNHTYSIINGPFERVVPGYYHRSWCNGLFSNGSGVGNEIASERPMVRQYIIDSLLFWQREFGFDGFRFDLMWLHDSETMYQIVEALRAVDPDVLIYGEPWRAATSPIEEAHRFVSIPIHLHGQSRWAGVHPTNHYAVSNVSNFPNWNQEIGRFGFFNNIFREIFMGHNDGPRRGFVTGETFQRGCPIEHLLWYAVRGIDIVYGYVHWASDTINYVSKHDNLILWDNISWSLGADWFGIGADSPVPTQPEWHTNIRTGDEFIDNQQFYLDPFFHINRENPLDNWAVRSHLLAVGVVLTSQGVPFLHAGDEFLRTKHGHRNTYRALDQYNAINWEQKIEFYDVFQFYRGLIELRRNMPEFRNDLLSSIHYELIQANERVLAYRLAGNIYVVFNGSPYEHTLLLGNTEILDILVNYRQAGVIPFGELQPNTPITVPPFSMFVLRQ